MEQPQEFEKPAGGASRSTDVLGRWLMKQDTPVRMGMSVFTLRAGAEVTVRQIDREYRKVLVDAGGRNTDWMSDTWLNNCVRHNAELTGADKRPG